MNINETSSTLKRTLGAEESQLPTAKKRRIAKKEEEHSSLTRYAVTSLYGPEQRQLPKVLNQGRWKEPPFTLSYRVFSNRNLFSVIKEFLAPKAQEGRETPELVTACSDKWREQFKTKSRALGKIRNFHGERISSRSSDFEAARLDALESHANEDEPYKLFCNWLMESVSVTAYRDLCRLARTSRHCYTQFHELVKRTKIGEAVVKAKYVAFTTTMDPRACIYLFNRADFNNDFEMLKLMLAHASRDLSHILMCNTSMTIRVRKHYDNPYATPYLRALALSEGESGLSARARDQRKEITTLFFHHVSALDFPIGTFQCNSPRRRVTLFEYLGENASNLFMMQLAKETNAKAEATLYALLINEVDRLGRNAFFFHILFRGYVGVLQALQKASPNAFSDFLSKVTVPLPHFKEMYDNLRPETSDACYQFLVEQGWRVEDQGGIAHFLKYGYWKTLKAIYTLQLTRSNYFNFNNSLRFAFQFVEKRGELLEGILKTLSGNQGRFGSEQPTLHEVVSIILDLYDQPGGFLNDQQTFLKALIKMGFDPCATDSNGNSVLDHLMLSVQKNAIYYLHNPDSYFNVVVSVLETFAEHFPEGGALHTLLDYPYSEHEYNAELEKEHRRIILEMLIKNGHNVNTLDNANIPWILKALNSGFNEMAAQLVQSGHLEKNLFNATVAIFKATNPLKELQTVTAAIQSKQAPFQQQPCLHEALQALLQMAFILKDAFKLDNSIQHFVKALLNLGLNPKAKYRQIPGSVRWEEHGSGKTALEFLLSLPQEIAPPPGAPDLMMILPEPNPPSTYCLLRKHLIDLISQR